MTNRRALTVYYDTGCNLCSRLVRFVLQQDKRKLISFKALADCPLKENGNRLPDSVIVEEGGQWYMKSEAAFRIVRAFGGIWQVLLLLRVVPKGLRDKVYDFVARNRYKWFGKSGATCAVNLHQ